MQHEHDIAGADELRPGESRTFTLECDGRRIEAFLVNYRDALHAYVNQCRHVPMTLDWVENRFFTEDGAYILCATHGALYDPATGACVGGACAGRGGLRALAVVERGGRVGWEPDGYAEAPAAPPG